MSYDEQSFLISGMGNAPYNDTLSGRLTKVSEADGTRAWSRSYSSVDYSLKNSTKLIKNECWGVAAVADGYILGCGTGIENCDDAGAVGTKLHTDCQAGTADPRAGAVPRQKGNWQSLVAKTDLDGTLLWQRVDSFRPNDKPELGKPGWYDASSASEYVRPTPDGGIVSFNDEAGGIGIMKLGPPAP